MKGTVLNINEYLNKKNLKNNMEDEIVQKELLAQKNGYKTYEDYEYSVAKEYSVNPNFSLNKEYYNVCQKYLIESIKSLLNLLNAARSFNNKDEDKVLTIYRVNQVIDAVYQKNDAVISVLDDNGLSINDFLKMLYSIELEKDDAYSLRLKKGM